MSSTLILQGLGGLAVVLAIAHTIRLSMSAINAGVFDAAMLKLLNAGDHERASKICRVVPNAFHAQAMVAMLDAASNLSSRTSKNSSIETIKAAGLRTYEQNAPKLRANRLFGFLPLGLAALAPLAASPLGEKLPLSEFHAAAVQLEPGWLYAPLGISLLVFLVMFRSISSRLKATPASIEILAPAIYTAVVGER